MEPTELGLIFGKLFLSCILGGLIGYEREARHKSAGLRTSLRLEIHDSRGGGACSMCLRSVFHRSVRHVPSLGAARSIARRGTLFCPEENFV